MLSPFACFCHAVPVCLFLLSFCVQRTQNESTQAHAVVLHANVTCTLCMHECVDAVCLRVSSSTQLHTLCAAHVCLPELQLCMKLSLCWRQLCNSADATIGIMLSWSVIQLDVSSPPSALLCAQAHEVHL
jgi:hypothetical protein